MLRSLALVIVCIVAGFAGELVRSLDPDGSVNIIWDVFAMDSTEYEVICVTIRNTQLSRSITNWRLSWTWVGDEVIWKAAGATTVEQGICRGKIKDLPLSCKRSPAMVDLSPSAPRLDRTPSCCRDGLLSSPVLDLNSSNTSFHMIVRNLDDRSAPSLEVPENFSLGLPGYSCASPAHRKPIYDPSWKIPQAFQSWQVICRFSQPYPPLCCLTLSKYDYPWTLEDYPSSICESDGSNCVEHDGVLGELCPVSVHWHVEKVFNTLWRVKINITNFSFERNYSPWYLLVQHPNVANIDKISHFNFTTLPAEQNATGLFMAMKERDTIISPRMYKHGRIWFRKPKGALARGMLIPDMVHFNGYECIFPKTKSFPELPPNRLIHKCNCKPWCPLAFSVFIVITAFYIYLFGM